MPCTLNSGTAEELCVRDTLIQICSILKAIAYKWNQYVTNINYEKLHMEYANRFSTMREGNIIDFNYLGQRAYPSWSDQL